MTHARHGRTLPAPLFRDPIHDGATDPTLVRNDDGTWWLFYTQRRAQDPALGVAWVHGTDIGVAVSEDGVTFTYRGTLALGDGWGRDTWWAPEVVRADDGWHMFVSVILGVPTQWAGHERHVEHHVSNDLVHWTSVGRVPLSSDRVIDACVARLPRPTPDGGVWRMWFKDEARDSTTWAADSPDLHAWHVVGPAVEGRPHEGPNVFGLGGWHWMLTDEWRGQAVHRSRDMTTWERAGLVLDTPGSRPDDGAIGLHADVVPLSEDEALVVYFTHPGRTETHADGEVTPGAMESPGERRSSIQAALLRVDGDRLVCDRDTPPPALPVEGRRQAGGVLGSPSSATTDS